MIDGDLFVFFRFSLVLGSGEFCQEKGYRVESLSRRKYSLGKEPIDDELRFGALSRTTPMTSLFLSNFVMPRPNDEASSNYS